MFPICPKCHQALDTVTSPASCPACGLVFAKYLAAQRGEPLHTATDAETPTANGPWWERFLAVPERSERWEVFARAGVYLFFFVWGWRLWFMDIRDGEMAGSFMHIVNLVFHEAGHVIFMFFGQFIYVAGGTLGQWLLPIIAGAALHWKNRDNFGASLALWWLAVSFMDAAPYAYDAADPVLPLLGGGTGADSNHDWVYMLGNTGLLEDARGIGRLLHVIGLVLLLLAYAWGALVLRRQFRQRVAETG
jgi:hypothetical protein